MNCTVYVVDNNNTILSEMKSDWHIAVARYMGQRDSKGNRYAIIPDGKPVPFKKKGIELKDISLRKESNQDIS